MRCGFSCTARPVSCGFYLYFWVKAGQTLGMRAWRMLLISSDGRPLTLRQACIRLVTSLAGIGNLWLLVRWGKGLALQDQLAGTIVVVLTKEQSSALNLQPGRAVAGVLQVWP